MSARNYSGIDQHVGRTPLIRLRQLSELTYQSKLFNSEWLAAHQLDPGQKLKSLWA